MGTLNPPRAANFGSVCSGLRSPVSRYSSACSGLVCSSTRRSGSRSGRSQTSRGPRSPPKPPSPLMNALPVLVTSASPVEASTATLSVTTSAPEPLS